MIRRSLPWVALGVAGLVALAGGLHLGQGSPESNDGGAAVRDGTPLLEIALPDMAGKDQALGQWKGKVLIVNFWATWCAPCREEMPQFVKAQREYGGKGLQFVGIAIDQPDKVQQFASEIGLNYPALIGGYGAIELSKTLGNRLGALPFTVIVDRAGRIVHTQLGPVKDVQLRSFISQLL
jgi:thiol-disulfide isomerase/thioredoxin